MICRLPVNVACLAPGYQIGKEVGRLSRAEDESDQQQANDTPESDAQPISFDQNTVS